MFIFREISFGCAILFVFAVLKCVFLCFVIRASRNVGILKERKSPKFPICVSTRTYMSGIFMKKYGIWREFPGSRGICQYSPCEDSRNILILPIIL